MKDRFSGNFNSFDDSVRSSDRYREVFSNILDSLMMDAVYFQFICSKDFAKI